MSRYRRAMKETKVKVSPFAGQLKTCNVCQAVHFMDPAHPSDWRFMVLTDRQGVSTEYAFCPKHFPPDGSSREAFTAAYLRIFQLLNLRISESTDLEFQSLE
jgi:hypothetical protein